MANTTGLVNDIFDILSDSTIKRTELASVMTDILLTMDENGILDGYDTELDDCMNVHSVLSESIQQFYSIINGDNVDDENLDNED